MKKKRAIYVIFASLVVAAILIVKISYSADNTAITSDNYEIKSNTIYSIPTSDSYALTELLENLNFSDAVDVQNTSNERIGDTELVGTGSKVKVSDTNLSVVVMGDVTGDGNINLGDVAKLYNAYKGKTTLSGSYLKAGKVTNNSDITLGDVAKLYNFYKGKSAFSYYSKDHPDGITNTVNKTVNTVAILKSTDLSVGKVVQTKGYYAANDGGGAKYKIEASANQTIDNGLYIKLDNGNVAKLLIGKKTVNVKQFGAKGDGTTDDHTAFNNAIKSGAVTIKIPDGTYNLNSNTITTTRYTRFIGNGQTKTTIKNGSVRARYGVRAEDITFDGGVSQSIAYVGVAAADGTVVFDVTPTGTRDIHYKNCTFKNVMAASLAKDHGGLGEDTKIKNDTAEGCTFENMARTAIYHNLRIGTGTYTNNHFINIGTDQTKTGMVSAIFLGDITNNTRYDADDVVIKDNEFRNLITKSNFDPHDVQEHIINANFIAIRAFKAVIDHNEVTNLIGYGQDREGIYTKVRDLTISNNTLTNAGYGEAYICAKPHDGEANFKITKNKLYGDGGSGIRSYGPGTVSGNEVYITNAPSAYVNTISDVVTIGSTNNYLIIKDNIFKCGVNETLSIDGETITSYNANSKVIGLSNVTIPVTFDNNHFETTTSYNSYISHINTGNSTIVKNNKFYLSGKTGNAVTVSTQETATYENAANSNIVIENNYYEIGKGFNALARTNFEVPAGASNRKVTFQNNRINYTGDEEGTVKVIVSSASSENNDKLTVKGNTTNSLKNKTTITTNLKYFELDDVNFARVYNNYTP